VRRWVPRPKVGEIATDNVANFYPQVATSGSFWRDWGTLASKSFLAQNVQYRLRLECRLLAQKGAQTRRGGLGGS